MKLPQHILDHIFWPGTWKVRVVRYTDEHWRGLDGNLLPEPHVETGEAKFVEVAEAVE
jgi:hypothetical protein